MSTLSHFETSTIGGIQQMAMTKAREDTMYGVQHKPGTTGMTGTRQTVDAYNAWFYENEDRPRVLAGPIRRAQANLGPDYKPVKGSELHGVQASSYRPGPIPSVRGTEAEQMTVQDSVPLPDVRNSFGHNTKTRFSRVR